MKLHNLFFRNEEQQETEEVVLWFVRWTARYNSYSCGLTPKVKAFPSKKNAELFAEALRDAYKLIEHTSDTEVIVSDKS